MSDQPAEALSNGPFEQALQAEMGYWTDVVWDVITEKLLPPLLASHLVRDCLTCGGQGTVGDGGYIACPTCGDGTIESEGK